MIIIVIVGQWEQNRVFPFDPLISFFFWGQEGVGSWEFEDCALMHFQYQGSKVIFLLNCVVKGICVWRWKFAIESEKEGLELGFIAKPYH